MRIKSTSKSTWTWTYGKVLSSVVHKYWYYQLQGYADFEILDATQGKKQKKKKSVEILGLLSLIAS